ncbi:hypothetical protein GPJ56_004272 [Histomonas meleagridis]|uniref:uncharacterized protein n=1 Tax=Histomonas meleagridis TaxID=135588 RepID=UPI00355AAFF8|nr:hypothetical protein GPJ56_004272 [Histomonas meleagridis]KAH0800514.1 hypothetical protein GO595_006717 [Histomonas meleagridis]
MEEENKAELLCSIARSQNQIKEVEQWSMSECKELKEKLLQLQQDLDDEIDKEEEYHRKISQRLNSIAKIKAEISQIVPEDTNFKIGP